ncbi:MAG: hypothetical protein WCI03_14405 [bacterium]
MKSGSTLIEVMMSIIILAVLAIAGAAYLGQANSMVAVQRNRMSALATASGYVEEIHATDWWGSAMTNRLPSPKSFVTNTVRRSGPCTWVSVSAGVTGFVTNNGVSMPVSTLIYYVDADGGGSSYDCVGATVSVGYRSGLSNQLVLHTLVGPRW